jgi:hypothetical protein
MKMVKNRARPTTTWLGGMLRTPMACRTMDRTITTRTKEVVMSRMLGATLKTVRAIWDSPAPVVKVSGRETSFRTGRACA